MEQSFVQRIAEIKEAQTQHDQEVATLLAEREQAPDRLRGAFDAAITNLEAKQMERLETYLGSDEVVEFVNEQAAQARQDIATIENLATRGLITESERQQHIAELFQSDDYSSFLAITSTAFEVFEEENNPFNVSILLATAEDQDSDNVIEPTTPENATADSEPEMKLEDSVTAPEGTLEQASTAEELEIIEVIYGKNQNRFFINGVELDTATYRHTVDTRIALIKAIARLPGGEPTQPGKLLDIAQEEFGLETGSDGKPNRAVAKGAIDWIFENVQTPDGVKLAEHNGASARGARITRTLGISATAQIIDSFGTSENLKESTAVTESADSEPPTNDITDRLQSEESKVDENEIDLRESMSDFTEDEETRRALYSVDKLVSPEFREHVRAILLHVKDVQRFSLIQMPDVLTETSKTTLTLSKLDSEILSDAKQLIEDAVQQSTEYIEALIELYDIDEPSVEELDAIEFLQQIEDIFRGEDIEGYILPGHIQNAEETLLMQEANLAISSNEGAVSIETSIYSEVSPELIEDIENTVNKLLDTHQLGETLGSLQAINMVGLKTRDLAIARDAGAVSRGNYERQGAKLTVEKLIHVFAFSKLRHVRGMTVAKAEKITSDIIAGLTK